MKKCVYVLLVMTLILSACDEKNEAPKVDAGVDQTLSLQQNSIQLNPLVSDDGLPEGSTLSYLWEKQSGEGNAAFDDPDSKQTMVTFSAAGVYVLKLSVSDSDLTGSDTIIITVTDDTSNLAPQVEAGRDQTIELSPNSIQLSPSVADDGLPAGMALSYAWTKKSGGGTVVFSDANSENPTVTFDAIGRYVLELTVSDSELNGTDTVTITVIDSGIASCGNEIIEPGEACDGRAANDLTPPAGYVSGSLECLPGCGGYIINDAVMGNTITAESCSEADIEAAIERANHGDIVIIPEGECIWEPPGDSSSHGVSVDKRLLIQGAGKDKTVITGYNMQTQRMFGFSTPGTRITGIGFKVYQSQKAIVVASKPGERMAGWRIDNCRFELIPGSSDRNGVRGVHIVGNSDFGVPVGVIDNCEFYNARVVAYGTANGMSANKIWTEDLNLGTNNAVFVENCTFTRAMKEAGNCIDSNHGGRYVFRHNTVKDMYIEAHSVQGHEGNSPNRATRSWEIYDNKLIRDNLENVCFNFPFSLRGGTGVVFNNDIIGPWQFLSRTNKGIGMDIKRNSTSAYENIRCDGKNYFSLIWDGPDGYPCRDQPGASKDSFVWIADDSIGSWKWERWVDPEYPAPSQEVDPVCEWNNNSYDNEVDEAGEDVDFLVYNDYWNLNRIQEGRDYRNDTERDGYVSYPHPHPLVTMEIN